MKYLAGAVCAGLGDRAESVGRSIRIAAGNSWKWQIQANRDISLAAASSESTPPPHIRQIGLGHNTLTIAGHVRLDDRSTVLEQLRLTSSEAESRSDLDLFLAIWFQRHRSALDQITGAFAVAIWDQDQRCLTLVRDQTGEFPLHFAHAGELCAFSSLAMPLRAVAGLNTSLDEEQMMRFLALLPGSPTNTLFRNIHKIPAGHLLTFKNGFIEVSRYWDPLAAPKVRFTKDEDYAEAFQEVFDRSVSARLKTTGSVGSELSGGMDSGSVTATAARLLDRGKLTAYTAIPQQAFQNLSPTGRFGNEGPAAARLAAMYPNIQHVFIEPSGTSLIGDFGGVEVQGYPVMNLLNQSWMSEILNDCRKRGIDVLLNGVCGNATISSSGLIGLSNLFRRGNWLQLANLIHQLRQRGHTGFRLALSMAIGPAIPSVLQRWIEPDAKNFSFAFSPLKPEIASRHRLREQSIEEMYGHHSGVEEYRRKNLEYFDPGSRNAAISQAWNIEMRDPTQDRRVFEFCYSIPIEQFLAEGQTRSLVRRAMRGRVPQSTLDCRDRGLQSADWYLTMGARRQELLDELALIRLSPMANRLLDLDRMQMLLENWPTKGFETQEVVYSWHLALSRGIGAGHFIRRFET